jgi:hypothetical protein
MKIDRTEIGRLKLELKIGSLEEGIIHNLISNFENACKSNDSLAASIALTKLNELGYTLTVDSIDMSNLTKE